MNARSVKGNERLNDKNMHSPALVILLREMLLYNGSGRLLVVSHIHTLPDGQQPSLTLANTSYSYLIEIPLRRG